MIKSVRVGILTPTKLGKREFGRVFLSILKPPFEPERYGSYEPIKLKYDPSDLESALTEWYFGFLWSRRKPRVRGHVVLSRSDFHDVIYLSLSLRAFQLAPTLDLIAGISRHFSVDFAYIHARTSDDTRDFELYKSRIMPFSQGLATMHLWQGVPDLCWGTVFGRPYREILGDRITGIPAYSVVEMGEVVFVQLTEQIADVGRNREKYAEVKEATKEHLLPSGIFGVSGQKARRAPEFTLISHSLSNPLKAPP